METSPSEGTPEDWIFRGTNTKRPEAINALPVPPPWRRFDHAARTERGQRYKARMKEIEMVNAALFLRRPLLVTGKPGVGKTSLAYAVAYELELGEVLTWSITTRSTLQQGLYHYDAIGRLQDASLQRTKQANEELPDIGRYIRLGPLGTALLPSARPRVLLIDEIDKSDIDLPNDLLHVFEEGEFDIPELARLPETPEYKTIPVLPANSREPVPVTRGRVRCDAFPLIILTSNGEREFPPAFLRRCLRVDIPEPTEAELKAIVEARLGGLLDRQVDQKEPHEAEQVKQAVANMIEMFSRERDEHKRMLATDQLLNAVYLTLQDVPLLARPQVKAAILRALTDIPT